MWIIGLEKSPIIISASKQVKDDALYSRNVWSKVFDAMRQVPPDFATADTEKNIIEEKQRLERKEKKPFQSRFGFINEANNSGQTLHD